MKQTPIDYTRITEIAKHCGMIPYTNRYGKIEEGKYTLEGFEAPIDLSACAEDEKSILRTAVAQLSKQVDEAYQDAIERDFLA